LQQRSDLSLYLFSVVIDEVIKEILGEVSWCMLFADDIVMVRENREEVNQRLYV